MTAGNILLSQGCIFRPQGVCIYLISRCYHYQLNCEAGHSTASSNHCFMIASFREQLGSKLAAHRHHGRAPAWLRLCLDCRDVSGVLWWPKRTKTHPFPVKKQQQCTTTLALSIQNSKMQYRKRNRLRNLPAQYSIYYMNHGKVVYIANHTTLDLGHRKFAVRYTPSHRRGVYLLQTSSDLGLG